MLENDETPLIDIGNDIDEEIDEAEIMVSFLSFSHFREPRMHTIFSQFANFVA